eukprot:3939271-Rhodomonas_salina.2
MGKPKDILTPEHAKYWKTPTAGSVSFEGIERDLHFTNKEDAQPYVLHWDIVSDILGILSERNTRADRGADLGCKLDEDEEVIYYLRATFPLKVYYSFTGSLLSSNSWTAAVETHCQ